MGPPDDLASLSSQPVTGAARPILPTRSPPSFRCGLDSHLIAIYPQRLPARDGLLRQYCPLIKQRPASASTSQLAWKACVSW